MKLTSSTLLRAVLTASVAAAAAMLASCTSMPLASSRSHESEGSRSAAMAPAAKLGTAWGESRGSRVHDTEFARAGSKPDGVGELHYYDDSLVDRHGGTDFCGSRELAGGRVSAGLKDARGRWLRGHEDGGRVYVFGQPGVRYEIVLRNLTADRIEVVVSVDGLDVLDGQPANFSKCGYVIRPRGSLTITGWRTSMSSVAAFRFAAVPDSYAARKHEDTRNVGVIGVAVFKEKGASSQRFAQPPPDGPEPNPFPGERWPRPARA